MKNSHDNLPVFGALPPSPIARANDRPSVLNEAEISNFLQHSLFVPKLKLPDQIFLNKIQVPEIDFLSLVLCKPDTVSSFLESVASTGCIQLVNHGISSELIRSVSLAASEIFGFEELDTAGKMETPEPEEFVWCKDKGLESVMAGYLLQEFSNNFGEEMENISTEIEKLAHHVLSALFQHAFISPAIFSGKQEGHNIVCYLHKRHRHTPDINLKYVDFSHALCVHVCDHSTTVEVYSQKGWISFTPNRNAIVMTIGDQVQAWNGGRYKNVISRPILKVEDEKPISMAFMYSPPSTTQKLNTGKTISLKQQLVFAIFLTLAYHLYVHL
ncbi:non-hem dioxygenase in morphine synthesis N-terminal [Ranunculus cassubicifolius]